MTSSVSRVEALASTIEQSLVDRRLAPGDRITTVAELRGTTGLAKQTITETLRLLADRGVVEIRPGRNGGAFVADSTPIVKIRRTLLAVPEGATTVADAADVRDALEELICLDAARVRSARDIAQLRTLARKMQRTASLVEFMKVNWALHERIAQITPNRVAQAVYLGTIRCISELSTPAASTAPDPGAYLDRRRAVHVELVEAIVSGDEKRTAKAVRAHKGTGTTRSASSAGD